MLGYSPTNIQKLRLLGESQLIGIIHFYSSYGVRCVPIPDYFPLSFIGILLKVNEMLDFDESRPIPNPNHPMLICTEI